MSGIPCATALVAIFASDPAGMRLRNSEVNIAPSVLVADDSEQEWDDAGAVNDLIISVEGTPRPWILGVGRIRGIGEHDVSVTMDTIRFAHERDDNKRRDR